jgi:hypothetical protein
MRLLTESVSLMILLRVIDGSAYLHTAITSIGLLTADPIMPYTKAVEAINPNSWF